MEDTFDKGAIPAGEDSASQSDWLSDETSFPLDGNEILARNVKFAWKSDLDEHSGRSYIPESIRQSVQAKPESDDPLSLHLLVEELFQRFLQSIPGEDANRDGLKETPHRMAKAYMEELLVGYTQDPNSVLKTFESVESSGLVIVANIPFYSLCEHHVLPFVGKAHIAYIPGERILGLSKFARLVDIFARRLQVQERLTRQLADTLHDGLNAKGVMVIMQAEHMCMTLRGAQAPGTITTTSEIRGLFRDVPALREEAMKLIQMTS